MRTVRNVAIILLLALGVAVIPGGGNVAQGFFALVTVMFLAAIGGLGYFLFRQQRFAWMTLTERQQAILLGALAAAILALAGADELVDSGLGLLAFLLLLGGAVIATIRVVAEARSM